MITSPTRRRAAAAAFAVGLLAPLVGLLGPASPGHAVEAAPQGEVRGQVRTPGGAPKLAVRWFTRDWTYLGQRRITGDIYSLSLAPGRYRIQVVDLGPAYDVRKLAPGDAAVSVQAGRVTQRDVRLRRGAAITGLARAGGRAAAGATVVATNGYQQSYQTTADRRGRFALGGLPTGRYSVFTWDRRGVWTGRSTWVGRLVQGRSRDVRTSLRTRAGSLLVDLYAGGERVRQTVSVTAVNRSTGQWWTVRARRGKAVFAGLHPGRYRLVAPGVGDFLPRTAPIAGGRVRAGRADVVSRFTWTRRGASVTGRVVDAAAPGTPMAGARVLLRDAAGRTLGESVSDGRGAFRIGGQLTTATGLSVVAAPRPESGGWMQGAAWCLFGEGRRGPLAVRTGQSTVAGDVALPRSTSAAQPDTCRAG